VILNYGSGSAPLTSTRNYLVNGRNAGAAAPAPWNGLGGIVSSYAHANGNGFNLAVGYADNAVLSTLRAAGLTPAFWVSR